MTIRWGRRSARRSLRPRRRHADPCVERLEWRLLLAASTLTAAVPDVAGQSESNSSPVLVRPVPDLVTSSGAPFKFNPRPVGSVNFGLEHELGGTGLTVTDNYFSSFVRFLKPWTEVTFTGNTLVDAPNPLVSVSLPAGVSPSEYVWDGNAYRSTLSRPLIYEGVAKSFADWQAETGFDPLGSFVPSLAGQDVFVRPNVYEPGRGHIIVYNWDRLSAVQVDLTSVVGIGAAYEIRNVLDLGGPPVVAGVFDGGPVTVPMDDTSAPVPVGHAPAAPLDTDREFGVFLVVAQAASVPGTGQSFFVSPTGSPAGDGSLAKPWDLATAMSHPAAVAPGDTIWLRGGTYHGGFNGQLTGTPAAPIHVRPWPGEFPRIDLFDTSPTTPTTIDVAGQDVTYQGFEVFSSNPATRTSQESGSFPSDINRGSISVTGHRIKLINLVVHDLDSGLAYWSAGDGGEIYGNLIFNNGWIGPDRTHGHGIYTQNSGSTRTIADNVIFHQFADGIEIYGSSAATLRNYSLTGNVSFSNGAAVGAGYSGKFDIVIGGGVPAENIALHQNFTSGLSSQFRDADPGDVLTYSARLLDGSPLPAWLAISPDEGTLFGTPLAADVGTLTVVLTATDSFGAFASDVFTLTVQPPHALGLWINGSSGNSSGIDRLTFQFDRPVTVDAATSLRLFNHTTGGLVDLAAATLEGNGSPTVTWRLAGVTVPNGRYTATLSGSAVVSTSFETMSPTFTAMTHRLSGDVSSDGRVNFGEFVVVSGHFDPTLGEPYRMGDADGDGRVSFLDFAHIGANFNPVGLSPLSLDFGDAPESGSSFATTLDRDGARHVITGNTLMLGATRDGEPDGQPDGAALWDGSDEDGLTVSALHPGESALITAVASGTGFLSAWIDWNADGDWTDAGEQVLSDVAVLSGSNALSISVPGGAAIGASVARFRLTSVAGYSWWGLAADGEVEDVQLVVSTPPAPLLVDLLRDDGIEPPGRERPAPTEVPSARHSLVSSVRAPHGRGSSGVPPAGVVPRGVAGPSETSAGPDAADVSHRDRWWYDFLDPEDGFQPSEGIVC
jgi:parallel beta-helix repeat protein